MNPKHRNDGSRAAIQPSRRQIVQAGGAAIGATALARFAAPLVRAAGLVKIGYVSPQTGALAPFAATDRFVIAGVRDLFKKQNRAIEIVVKDSQSSSARASDVAADLILRDKVSLVLVGAAPETDNPVSDQCELNEVPCVSTVSRRQARQAVQMDLSLLLGSRGCHRRLYRHVAATRDQPHRGRRLRQRRGRQC